MRAGIILCLENLDSNFAPIFGDINFGLLNIRNRPLILHSIEFLVQNGVNKLYITVNSNYKEYVALLNSVANITYVLDETNKSYDITVKETLLKVKEKECILTDVRIYNYKTFKNVLKHNHDNLKVASPCYFNKENILEAVECDKINYEIFNQPFGDANFKFDHLYVKTINDYYNAQRLMISGRFFNSFKCNFFNNTLRKESSHQKTLRNEILWYINLPRQLQPFIPKIIDYSVTDDIFVDLEYCSFPLLADIFVYGKWSIDVWKLILDRLFAIHEKFCSFTTHITQESYTKIYIDKLDQRIASVVESSEQIARLLKAETLVINEKEYEGWPRLKSKVLHFSKEIYDVKGSIIHGDFFLSNMFFDPFSGVIKLIDPRGEWDKVGVYGDPKYDMAKLRHSISGKFDFIIRDMFELDFDNLNISYKFKFVDYEIQVMLPEIFDNMLSTRYDIKHIKFIEALLFISMLPLHNDSPSRQMIQLATGIQQLNEIL